MSNILILGTGSVGQAIGGKLLSLGHIVTLGTRNVSDSLNKTADDAAIGSWIQKYKDTKLVNFRDILHVDCGLEQPIHKNMSLIALLSKQYLGWILSEQSFNLFPEYL